MNDSNVKIVEKLTDTMPKHEKPRSPYNFHELVSTIPTVSNRHAMLCTLQRLLNDRQYILGTNVINIFLIIQESEIV